MLTSRSFLVRGAGSASSAASSALVGSSKDSSASDSVATALTDLPETGPATKASSAAEVNTTSSLTSTS